MKLDSVLTVAIGDIDTDGNKLTPTEWSDFRSDMRQVLETYGTVVAEATGDGVRSDDCVDEGDDHELEGTCVFIVINHEQNMGIRSHVAQVIRAYGQSSCCFAIDRAHEPVFATRTGNRDGVVHNPLTTKFEDLTDIEQDLLTPSPFTVVGGISFDIGGFDGEDDTV